MTSKAKLRPRRRAEIGSCLTDREAEVLRLVGQGFPSAEIARQLGISINTVANHRKACCRKLGARSTAELTLAAFRYFRGMARGAGA